MDSYQEAGGAYVGRDRWTSFAATFPLVVLTVQSQSITLVMLWDLPIIGRRYHFERADIEEIRKYAPARVLPGIQIVHSKPGYPPFVVFGGFSYKRLKNYLTEFGYEVNEE